MANEPKEVKPDVPEIPVAVVPGYLLGGIILIGLVYVSYALQDMRPERFFNMLLLAAGGSSGWVMGILLSPRGQQQQRQFETLGRAIGTFISGFVLAKIASLFEGLTSGTSWNLINGVRLLVLLVSFVLGLLFVFVGRTQSKPEEPRPRWRSTETWKSKLLPMELSSTFVLPATAFASPLEGGILRWAASRSVLTWPVLSLLVPIRPECSTF